jgi:hypothetical protein
MHELRDKIRKALAGTSSTTPVDTRELLPLGTADEVAIALDELLASREINTAASTKGARLYRFIVRVHGTEIAA